LEVVGEVPGEVVVPVPVGLLVVPARVLEVPPDELGVLVVRG